MNTAISAKADIKQDGSGPRVVQSKPGGLFETGIPSPVVEFALGIQQNWLGEVYSCRERMNFQDFDTDPQGRQQNGNSR
jgi:hypothetical protein